MHYNDEWFDFFDMSNRWHLLEITTSKGGYFGGASAMHRNIILTPFE